MDHKLSIVHRPSSIVHRRKRIGMKRIGFVLKVKQDKLEEYKRHHEQVWPEMLQALRDAGWHNYSLFVRDDGLLFGYFETPDSLQTAQALMAETKVNTRWQEFMAPFFESPNNARPDEMFVELTEIFHLG
jgi:L-rhamnose mutarotase